MLLTATVTVATAQAPQAIPFQGAVRNANNVLLANKTITVRFSIRNGYSFGNIVYREWQSTVTNSQGLFVLNVGQGNTDIGQFASINWSDSTKFMQVEIDTTNTRSVWRDIGTQQMLSVPYALNAKAADNGNPSGSIIAFGGTIAPTGFLLCNGAAVSRTTYANLFAAIGTAYGAGNGSTTFNIPDFRGKFLRGVDGGTGFDPGAATRTVSGVGGNTGNVVGSYQSDAFSSHDHFQFTDGNYNTSTYLTNSQTTSPTWINNFDGLTLYNYIIVADPNAGKRATLYPGSKTGGNETRPVNVYVNYIIKQ